MARTNLSALADENLVSELAVRQRALVKARFALSLGRLENTASIGSIRRDIARINTELRKREIATGAAVGSIARGFGGKLAPKAASAESAAPFLAGLDTDAE